MPRIHSDPNQALGVLSGILGVALVGHTKERMHHFFLFLYTYRLLMNVLECAPNKWADNVSIKATHQCDTGVRRDEAWRTGFKNDDVSVLNFYVTDFRRVDASDFCNLGLNPALAGLCDQGAYERARHLYNMLVRVCANTRLMPQRINIGPDRVVDVAHGELCMAFLKQMASGAAPISNPFLKRYKERVTSGMALYKAGQADKGNDAVAEAAGIYIATLEESEAPQELRSQGTASKWINTRCTHSQEVWTTLQGNAQGDFLGYGFNRDANVDISMLVTR